MYKLVLTAALCICCSLLVHAQTTAPSPAPETSAISMPALAQGSYPLSVIVKVKEVASLVSLSDAQQVSLADFFVQEDKLLAESMDSNAIPQQLGQLRAQLTARFQALLTAAQLATYSAGRPNSHLAVHNYSRPSAPYKP